MEDMILSFLQNVGASLVAGLLLIWWQHCDKDKK